MEAKSILLITKYNNTKKGSENAHQTLRAWRWLKDLRGLKPAHRSKTTWKLSKNWAGSGGSSIHSIRASPRNAKREHCWTAGAAQGACHTKQLLKKILALASRHSRNTGDHATPENTSSRTQHHTNIWHCTEVILTWQRWCLRPRRREREQTTSKPTTQKKVNSL